MSDFEQLRVTAHPIRLQILSLLTGNSMSQGEVAKSLGFSNAAISYHFNTLKSAGWLKETGTKSVRGGTAHLFTYNSASISSKKQRNLGPSSWQAVGSELIRRAKHFRKGVQLLADADIHIDPQTWHELATEMQSIVIRIHEAAVPPKSKNAVRVNLTVAMFEMKDKQ